MSPPTQPTPHPHDVAFSGISRLQDAVFFLQIGAADGRRFDPIHYFVRRYAWGGVLVEPLPDIFELLKTNYAGQENLAFENAAITERDGTGTISRVPMDKVGEGDVPGWAFGASTLTPEKTRFARSNSPERLHAALSSAAVTEEVRCMSLASLLEKHGIGRIDVLQLDTEGYDARILRQLDLVRYRPTIINMEWQWLDDAERNEVGERLRAEGYSLYGCEADLLATARPLEDLAVLPPVPTIDSVPRPFPGVRGYSVETSDGGLDGVASRQTDRIVFRRARGTRVSIPAPRGLPVLLSLIDGVRSYGEMADAMRCPVQTLLGWGRQLQSLYLVE